MRFKPYVPLVVGSVMLGACNMEKLTGINEEENAHVYDISRVYPLHPTIIGKKVVFYDDNGNLEMILEDYGSGELCDEGRDYVTIRVGDTYVLSRPITPENSSILPTHTDSFMTVDECEPYKQQYSDAIAGADSISKK